MPRKLPALVIPQKIVQPGPFNDGVIPTGEPFKVGTSAGVVIGCTLTAPANAVVIAAGATAGYNQHYSARSPTQIAYVIELPQLKWLGGDQVQNVQPGEWIYFVLAHQPDPTWLAAHPNSYDSILEATVNR